MTTQAVRPQWEELIVVRYARQDWLAAWSASKSV
jgi:hypothetical protein